MQKEIIKEENLTRFIEVCDGTRTHNLMMSLKGSYNFQEYEFGRIWESGHLDLRVHYLFGPYQRKIGDEIIHMEASINSDAVLLSNGEIMLKCEELRGKGIASYAFNHLVSWVKQNAESTKKVKPLRLGPADAENEVNKKRRNTMYQKFGFRLEFVDDNEGVGYAVVDKLADVNLIDPSEWGKIKSDSQFKGFEKLSKELGTVREKYRADEARAKIFLKKWFRIRGIINTLGVYLRWIVNLPLMIAVGMVGLIIGTYLNESTCAYVHKSFLTIFPW